MQCKLPNDETITIELQNVKTGVTNSLLEAQLIPIPPSNQQLPSSPNAQKILILPETIGFFSDKSKSQSGINTDNALLFFESYTQHILAIFHHYVSLKTTKELCQFYIDQISNTEKTEIQKRDKKIWQYQKLIKEIEKEQVDLSKDYEDDDIKNMLVKLRQKLSGKQDIIRILKEKIKNCVELNIEALSAGNEYSQKILKFLYKEIINEENNNSTNNQPIIMRYVYHGSKHDFDQWEQAVQGLMINFAETLKEARKKTENHIKKSSNVIVSTAFLIFLCLVVLLINIAAVIHSFWHGLPQQMQEIIEDNGTPPTLEAVFYQNKMDMNALERKSLSFEQQYIIAKNFQSLYAQTMKIPLIKEVDNKIYVLIPPGEGFRKQGGPINYYVNKPFYITINKFCSANVPKSQLPTRDQWEWACRSGVSTRFNYGDGEARRKWPSAWGLINCHDATKERVKIINPETKEIIWKTMGGIVNGQHRDCSTCYNINDKKSCYVRQVMEVQIQGGVAWSSLLMIICFITIFLILLFFLYRLNKDVGWFGTVKKKISDNSSRTVNFSKCVVQRCRLR